MRRYHSKMHLSEANSRRQFSKNSREMRNFLNDLGFKKGGEKTGHSSLPAQETERLFLLPDARPFGQQNWLAALDDGGIHAVETFVVGRTVIQDQLRAKSGIHLMN